MNVQLVSAEGDVFTVERQVVSLSVVLNNAIKDYDDTSELEPIKLPEISTRILGKVIDYCRYHWDNPAKPIPKPLKSARLNEFVCPWDFEFVNVSKEVLFELIMAENFLDIKPLLDLTCAKLASMIKGKSVQDIRDEFNIVNDFTPEEEARIREENKWCAEL
ncbi:glyco FP21 [Babesia ovata]|uniref:Glyco FP21 n=1 Tax=Babesia ovata TaxID=189622 RepID=A0A2H6KH40_9APIC|nr:glyco FP21 [Babesia ovata]GBE62289.1 glyco FP21 [Babesia ovata]